MLTKSINQIVSIVNLILGVSYFILAPLSLLSLSSINSLYSDFELVNKTPMLPLSFGAVFLLILGAFNVYSGRQGLINKKKEKLFTLGLISVVFALILGPIIGILAGLPAILSIYNLTSQFQ